MPSIRQGVVARCQAERKNRRLSNASSSTSPLGTSPREQLQRQTKRPRTSTDDVCGGVFKPCVTFFGETLDNVVRRSLETDREKVDALIVIGTSLSVAPISKVIEYLPPGIPRILINRTIVHPSTRSPDDVAEEPEFRKNYVFDAYLLGYCDDVTRALAKRLFRDDVATTPTQKKRKGNTTTGHLLAKVLKGEEQGYNAEDWNSVTVPAERVLLFPGALSSQADNSDDITYREIAHCDGCSKRIRGNIRKCIDCFDYDLCEKCFPEASLSHYEGKHRFTCEPAMS